MADHARVRALFERLRGLDGGARKIALDELKPEDADLKAAVEELLSNAGDWTALESPPLGSAAALIDDAEQPRGVPDLRISGYRLVRVIGEGGMGLVYEAEQETPRRRVALKVLHPGLTSPARMQRFRHESEVLGRLNHPGIARIFEAGTYLAGNREHPFFAMEYVEGSPLLEYAEANSLGLTARVELVIQVCEAIDHAHQRGVIHRDLKPSNLQMSADGVVKVLDFGVARSIEADTYLQTMGTGTGELIGTLAYMSPEQLAGNPDALDTRTDIYAIGAVAYELLSGRPLHDIAGRSLPDAIISVRDAAHSSLGTISPALRGDLSTIIMKALEHDPERRYPGASALAADLSRYLRHEPIEARTPTVTYQLRKFAARNRGFVAAVASVFVVLIIGLGATAAGLAWALGAESAAEQNALIAAREAAIARAVNEFLNDDLLSAIDPARAEDRDITMRAVVDRAAERIEGRFPDEPLVEAAIRITLARVYERLGQAGTGEAHWRRALALHEQTNGAEAPETITTSASLATNLMDQSRFDEAVVLIEHNLELLRRAPEPDEGEILKSTGNLAAAYLRIGRLDAAAPLLAESLAGKRRTMGDRDPSTLTSINNLAGLYFSLGQADKAEPLYREAYEGRLDVLGEGDLGTMRSMAGLALALAELGQHDEAERLLLDDLAVINERLDEDHPTRAQVMNSLGSTLEAAGRLSEAERWFREVIALRSRSLGENHLQTLYSKLNLANVVLARNRAAEAADIYREVLAGDAEGVPPDHWYRGAAMVGLGRALARLDEPEQAERTLIEGTCHLARALGPSNIRTSRALGSLAEFFESTDQSQRADEIRDALEAGELPPSLCPPRGPDVAR